MREAARFLETLSDILDHVVAGGMESDGLTLLLEAARKDVETVHLADPAADYEIGDGDVFWRGRALAGTAEWAWRERLLAAGVDRLSPPDDATAFREWVGSIRERLSEEQQPAGEAHPPPTPPPNAFSLDEEAERVWWLHGEAANRGQVPRRESEDLIERLMRVLQRGAATSKRRSLEVFDELTTVHVLNVTLLALGMGRHLAFDEAEIHGLGLAGLYHDVGRVRLSEADHGRDPTSEARRTLLATHPEAGARVLMDSGRWFAVAAVVAYEHHLTWRGNGGYPSLHFPRPPHQYSRIISVCDTYDALRTERAHRPALTCDAATEYLRMLAGRTLDPEIVTGFAGYVSEPVTYVAHPRSRAEATLSEVSWLPDTGFDPDFEPRPVSI